MASKIMEIVRGVVGYKVLVYNDRLKGGVRSIKLNWGHNAAQNAAVKAALEAAGYKVKMVKSWGMAGLGRGVLGSSGAQRMHVSE